MKQPLTNTVGVGELTSVEAKLTDAGEGGFVRPVVTGANTIENVSSLNTVCIKVEVTVTTDELVTSEGFDGLDGFLDFHGWFLFAYRSILLWNKAYVNPLCTTPPAVTSLCTLLPTHYR